MVRVGRSPFPRKRHTLGGSLTRARRCGHGSFAGTRSPCRSLVTKDTETETARGGGAFRGTLYRGRLVCVGLAGNLGGLGLPLRTLASPSRYQIDRSRTRDSLRNAVARGECHATPRYRFVCLCLGSARSRKCHSRLVDPLGESSLLRTGTIGFQQAFPIVVVLIIGSNGWRKRL
jgi:hypothetical protein